MVPPAEVVGMAGTDSVFPPTADPDEGLSSAELDALLDLLQHSRRRQVIDELVDADGAVPLADLAEAVARREATDGDGGDAPAVDSVRLSLAHSHLPRLRDAGVARFDADEGVAALVRDGDRATRLVELREAVDDVARRA